MRVIFGTVVLILFSAPVFAGQKYVCDIGKFGDGSAGISRFGLDIQSDKLFMTKDIGKSYAKRVEWKKLEAFTYSGVTQTLYSSSKEWKHMMVIKKKGKQSVEIHTRAIRFEVDFGGAQKKYGIEHYPMFYFAKCVTF